ncbi:LuxR C-terminal-related transcriptional regulator [Microbacterium sp. NPDC056052]|uniref:helix-turn-helix transcriptional regulator n=1 Tax=Microbacterium sp. NPDC056052 TaxID=3345695 RepID=UPI0035DB4127
MIDPYHRIALSVASSTETAVAPHVLGALVREGYTSPTDFVELASILTEEQLAGLSVLPDPIPATDSLLRRHQMLLAGIGQSGAHILLAAVLSVTDRVDVLLAASGSDPAVLLDPQMRRLISIKDGRFTLAAPGIGTVVHRMSSPAKRGPMHAALARAHQALHLRGPAQWHHALSGAEPHSHLVGHAHHLLTTGLVVPAFHVGRLLADAPAKDRTVRAEAELVAARAALAQGAYMDAASFFLRASERGDTVVRAKAQEGIRAARNFLDGPDPRQDYVDQIRSQISDLAVAAVTATDAVVVEAVQRLSKNWASDPDEVDAIHAAMMMMATRSRPNGPWTASDVSLSPLIDGYAQGQNIGILLHAGAHAEAAIGLRAALTTLPMTHLAAGVTSHALRMLAETDPRLFEAFEPQLRRIRPRNIAHLQIADPVPGARSVQLSRIAPADTNLVVDALTRREGDVAGLVARGLNNRDIGAQLGVSDRTVEVHLTSIYRKLSVKSRAELIARIHDRTPTPSSSSDR